MGYIDSKDVIDEMDYIKMLDLWRHAKPGYFLFEGNIGAYFEKSMKEKKDKLSHVEQVAASKFVGWGDD